MEIENRIRQFILENLYYAEGDFIGDEDSFLETGVIDSMGVMELVAFIQSEFALEVEQREIVVENFDSIRKLGNFVRQQLALKEATGSVLETTAESDARSLASRWSGNRCILQPSRVSYTNQHRTSVLAG